MVHPQAAIGPEALIEPGLQRRRLRTQIALRIEPSVGRDPGVGPTEDVRRFGEHLPGVRDEHRHRPTSSGEPRGEDMDELQVRVLDVVDSGAVQRPACLLAEVADRNCHQTTAHAASVAQRLPSHAQSVRRDGRWQRDQPLRSGFPSSSRDGRWFATRSSSERRASVKRLGTAASSPSSHRVRTTSSRDSGRQT